MSTHFLNSTAPATALAFESIDIRWPDNQASHPLRIRTTTWQGGPKLGRTLRRRAQSTLARQTMEELLAEMHRGPDIPAWVLRKQTNGQLTAQGLDAPSISVSHSKDWVVCAAGRVSRLGVDVEGLRSMDWAAAAGLALHPAEADWVLAAQGTEQQWRGLQCWTGKEALLKAIGPTPERWAQITQVAFSPTGQLLNMPSSWGLPSDWTTHCWRLAQGAVLSVAWQ